MAKSTAADEYLADALAASAALYSRIPPSRRFYVLDAETTLSNALHELHALASQAPKKNTTQKEAKT